MSVYLCVGAVAFELNIFCLHVLINFNTTGVISKVKVVGQTNGNRIKNPFLSAADAH